MKLSVTQENLSKALTIVGRVASSKTQLPILNNILLRTDGTRLLIAATNLEIATTQLIGAKVTAPGAITIPAKLVVEFVSSLPKGTVELEVKESRLHISAGSYSSTIHGVIADEFPELPTIDESTSVHYTINTVDFKQAVSQTIITSGSDNTRPVLTGVFWHSFEGFLYLAATDGYRLSERKLIETKSEIAAIIPTTTLQEVLRTLTDDVSEIDVLFDETQVRFRVGESEVTSRLIDGNYPDYRQLIPVRSETEIIVSTGEFTRITKIAGLFARESGGSITITADKEKQSFAIHSIASQIGENTSHSDAKISSDGQVTLNSRYLSEALSVIDGDTVIFGFSGKLAPCVLTTKTKDVTYKHIIMPLKS